jgi:hypothetical protein
VSERVCLYASVCMSVRGGGGGWIRQAQGRDQWQSPVLMNIRVSLQIANFLTN